MRRRRAFSDVLVCSDSPVCEEIGCDNSHLCQSAALADNAVAVWKQNVSSFSCETTQLYPRTGDFPKALPPARANTTESFTTYVSILGWQLLGCSKKQFFSLHYFIRGWFLVTLTEKIPSMWRRRLKMTYLVSPGYRCHSDNPLSVPKYTIHQMELLTFNVSDNISSDRSCYDGSKSNNIANFQIQISSSTEVRG